MVVITGASHQVGGGKGLLLKVGAEPMITRETHLEDPLCGTSCTYEGRLPRHAPYSPHGVFAIPSLTVNPVIGIVGRMLVVALAHDTLRHQA